MFEFVLFLKAGILGVLQGLTEFIPVSSTAHMIIVGKLLKFEGEFANTFEVFIQLGTTCALIWYFRKDLNKRIAGFFKSFSTENENKKNIYKNTDFKFLIYLFIAFLPAAIFGLLFHKKIEFLFNSALSIGIAQILGACLILFAEHKSAEFRNPTHSLNTVSWRQALAVGVWQIAAFWPGMSRSGSTIMGGLLAKIDRPTATQFSFYLSIPISICSSVFMLLKHHDIFNSMQEILLLCVGFISAFAVGLAVVNFIMQFVRTHSFVVFAYYRFVLAGVILFLVWRQVL